MNALLILLYTLISFLVLYEIFKFKIYIRDIKERVTLMENFVDISIKSVNQIYNVLTSNDDQNKEKNKVIIEIIKKIKLVEKDFIDFQKEVSEFALATSEYLNLENEEMKSSPINSIMNTSKKGNKKPD